MTAKEVKLSFGERNKEIKDIFINRKTKAIIQNYFSVEHKPRIFFPSLIWISSKQANGTTYLYILLGEKQQHQQKLFEIFYDMST